VTSRELTKLLQSKGCALDRSGKGSHQIWSCPGGCRNVIPTHRGDVPTGTLRSILKSFEPCLGKDWWK